MEDRKRHIDDLFRDGLGDYQESPASDIWSKLDQRLPVAEVPAAARPASNRKWLWLLLLLALLGMIGYLLLRRSSETTSLRQDGAGQSQTSAGAAGDVAANTQEQSGNNATWPDISDNPAPGGPAMPADEDHASGGGDKTAGTTDNSISGKGSGPARVTGSAPAGTADNTVASGRAPAGQGGQRGEQPGSSDVATSAPSGGRGGARTGLAEGQQGSGGTATENGNTIRPASGGSATRQSNNQKSAKPQTEPEDLSATAGSGPGRKRNAGGASRAANNSRGTATTAATEQEKTGKADKQPADPIKRSAGTAGETPATQRTSRTKETVASSMPDNSVNSGSRQNGSAGKEKIGDVAVNMGKKNKTAAPAPQAPAEPSKKFEVTKQGVKLLTDPEAEEERESDITVNENDDADSEETDQQAAASPEPEEVAQPVLATGTNPDPANNSSSSGGGGGGKEPKVPLRSFAPGARLEAGFKFGYERSMGQIAVNSAVFSPYLQWNLSPKVALVLQPSFRYNSINRNLFSGMQSYHDILSAVRDSGHITSLDSFQGQIDTVIERNYFFYHTYDSVVRVRKLNTANYWEIDLPLMIKFNIGSGFSLMGGMYLTYGNLLRVTESESRYQGLQRSDTLSFPAVPASNPAPQVPGAAGYFQYNTPDASTAPPLSGAASYGNDARVGYMIGVNYDLGQRFMVEALLRQNLSDMKFIQNEQLRKVYTQPNIRISVGVKLFQGGQKTRNVNPDGL